MATWIQYMKTVRTQVYTIPAIAAYGACWTDVLQAVHAAREAYYAAYGNPDSISDDAINIFARDDAITVEFELP